MNAAVDVSSLRASATAPELLDTGCAIHGDLGPLGTTLLSRVFERVAAEDSFEVLWPDIARGLIRRVEEEVHVLVFC